jgi:hypothetical protein
LNGGSFSGLLAMRSLQLSDNHLEQVSGQSLAGLESLQALFLRNNRLASVPAAALRLLKSLRLVDLSGCARLQQLRELDFAHSFARRLVLNGLQQLRRIHRLAFFDLPALLDVRVRGARSLTYLDEQALLGAPQLRSLNLQASGLQSLDGRLLETIGRHVQQTSGRRVQIDLTGSALQCDCLLKPLHNVRPRS